ncbi:unnamed protein product [Adineta ricciae]|uniref:Uncharacterized protein n=1 Tax=Adineta ricciae TaxID=249248 RepID=A0A815WDF8_ADIRI|nr:unnamed protein product [Adineta ricciae]
MTATYVENQLALTSDQHLSELNDDLTLVTDLNLLKIHLIRQRKKLFSTLDLLIKLDLSYESIVPKIDHDDLTMDYTRLNGEYNRLKDEYQHLGHSCLYLINKTHDLIEERNQYYNQWQANKNLLTPRPDWDKISNVIDGGFERWKSLSTGKSSEQLVDVLIKEIINGNDIDAFEGKDYFESDGDQKAVLPFLRTSTENRIFNRRMRERMAGILIKEIWTEKIHKSNYWQIRDFQSSSPASFADQVAEYFEKRFASKSVAVELGYNLRDACLRYHNCEEINLFWGILTGQIEEMVYHHRMKTISDLLQHLIRMKTVFSSQPEIILSNARKAIVGELSSPVSSRANRLLSGLPSPSAKSYFESPAARENLVMTDDQFLESLDLIYPHKASSQIDELFLSAKHDLSYSSPFIEFSLLFIEDNSGRFSHFLTTLIKQLNEEKFAYIAQIKRILLGYPLITISQFSRAVSMIDPNISQSELHRYIEWVFSAKNYHSSQQTVKPLDLEDLLRRLENCACFKH